MLGGDYYEVETYWGRFRLDEGAYRDYLEGKLWLNWVPGDTKKKGGSPAAPAGAEMPVNISERAERLCSQTGERGAFSVMLEAFPEMKLFFPYRSRMSGISIDGMNLSVRSSNGLKRADAHTLGRLMEIIDSEAGLRRVRNLGEKSVKEITREFFEICYSLLSKGERAAFWQKTIDACSTEGE